MVEKLAILTPGFKPVPAVQGGAVEQLVQYFIEENEKYHKYDIDLYTVNDSQLNSIKYKYTNFIVVNDNCNSLISRGFYKLKRQLYRLLASKKFIYYVGDEFVKLYRSNYYDMVLVENIMDLYLGILPKITTEKLYFHLHNDLDLDERGGITAQKAKEILKTVTKFIVPSNFLRKKIVQLSPKFKYKVKVAYNGVISDNLKTISENDKSKLKRKYKIENNDIVFTYIGTLSAEKGVDQFLYAMKSLKKYPQIKGLVVGTNTEHSKKSIDFLKKINRISEKISEKVKFIGYVDNKKINRIYSISDCIVVPTQIEEIFGVVALEAITMGIPVVASISGGLQEVLNSNCAIYVKKDDNFVNHLSKAMLKIANNTKLRHKMKFEGQIQARKFPNSKKEYFMNVLEILEEK